MNDSFFTLTGSVRVARGPLPFEIKLQTAMEAEVWQDPWEMIQDCYRMGVFNINPEQGYHQGRLKIDTRELSASGLELRGSLDRLDPSLVTALIRSWNQCALLLEEPLHVHLDMGPPGSGATHAEAFVLQHRMRSSSVPPFTCVAEINEDRMAARTVRMLFSKAISDANFETVVRGLERWCQLATNGAFEESLDCLEEPVLDPGEFYLVSPVRLEFGLIDVHLSQEGLVALTNFALWCHHHVHALSRFELD